jgi:hypothetical protein
MRNRKLKLKILNFSVQLLVIVSLSGCSIVEYFTPEERPYDEQIYKSYSDVKLKTSNSADVLESILLPEYEQGEEGKSPYSQPKLVSQSKSVIAVTGEKKKGYKTWLKMVAFDENELTATRKYFFVVDEKPKTLSFEPRPKLSFESEMVLKKDVLDQPYSNENARRIAILRQVLANVRSDIDEVGPDNKTVAVCGMLINQALETVLVKLDSSPVLATGLDSENGVEFEHISLDKGKIRMVAADDIVTAKVEIGSLAREFEDPFALD